MFDFIKNYGMITVPKAFVKSRKIPTMASILKESSQKRFNHFTFYFSGTQGFQTLAGS